MPVAQAYLNAGYEVVGYDIRPELLLELVKLGGKPAQSSKDVAAVADVIMIMVLNDQQVLQATTKDDGFFQTIKRMRL